MDTCKICGAPRDPLNSNCKFCGTAYALEKVTGEIYINALGTILTHIDEKESNRLANQSVGNQVIGMVSPAGMRQAMYGAADDKVTAISTFAMPSDLESLLQFLAFCHGNAQMKISYHDKGGARIKVAWNGKAKMAYAQLKMKAISNPEIAPYIQEYESIYGNAKASGGLVGLINRMLFGKK